MCPLIYLDVVHYRSRRNCQVVLWNNWRSIHHQHTTDGWRFVEDSAPNVLCPCATITSAHWTPQVFARLRVLVRRWLVHRCWQLNALDWNPPSIHRLDPASRLRWLVIVQCTEPVSKAQRVVIERKKDGLMDLSYRIDQFDSIKLYTHCRVNDCQ